MDSKSLEVISRFKDALATRNKLESSLANPSTKITSTTTSSSSTTEANDTLPTYNRGLKLHFQNPSLDSLNAKSVEYNGEKYTVLTNDSIERGNIRNKRKWNEFYNDGDAKEGDEYENDVEWSDEDEEEIHP